MSTLRRTVLMSFILHVFFQNQQFKFYYIELFRFFITSAIQLNYAKNINVIRNI